MNIVVYAPQNGVDWTGDHVTALFDSIERRINFQCKPVALTRHINFPENIHFDIKQIKSRNEIDVDDSFFIPLNFVPMYDMNSIADMFLAGERDHTAFIKRRTVADMETGAFGEGMVEAAILPRCCDPLTHGPMRGVDLPRLYCMKSRAIVMGAAQCLFDDLSIAKHLRADRVVVNRVGCMYSGRIHHWVSVHPDYFWAWKKVRSDKGWNQDYTTWGHLPWVHVDKHSNQYGGSSGMFGATVALECGYEEVILCGIPLEMSEGHLYDNRLDQLGLFEQYKGAWVQHLDKLVPRVRSLSGWTRQLVEKERKKHVAFDSELMLGL